MSDVTICYWKRVRDRTGAGLIFYTPGCIVGKLWLFDSNEDLDAWQYCPFCGRPLSTATPEDANAPR